MMLLMVQHGYIVKSVLALAFALAATGCLAGSSMSTAGGVATGSAGLMFKIVIPPVLILDTTTGTIYSNDAKAVMLVGTTAMSVAPVVRVAHANGAASGLHRVSASGHATGRLVARNLESGEVLCSP